MWFYAGLDSSNAARVVDILAGLASAGVTVIITIHQPRPDVFNLMQRVLILSGDGRMVYSGKHALFLAALHSCLLSLLCLLLRLALQLHVLSQTWGAVCFAADRE